MSSAVFYRTALDRTLSEGTRRLFTSLLARNEQIERFFRDQAAGPGGASAGGDPGESVPVTATQEKILSMEGTVKMLVSLLSSEPLLVQTALETEQSALEYERELQETGDAEDRELGRSIIALRELNVRELRAYRGTR